MKLICGICEIDDGDTLHIYDARGGHPVHVQSILADGTTTHVLPIETGDCIVIVPHAAMRVDPAPLAAVETASPAVVDPAPPAVVDPAPPAVVDPAPPAVVDPAPPAVVDPAPPAVVDPAPPVENA